MQDIMRFVPCPRSLHLGLEWLAPETKSPFAGAATTSFPPSPTPSMALSHGGPSPLASLTQLTAAANESHSPEHSEDGCSWCDEGRLAPGTRPPTCGKSVIETVTPPTHVHQCPLAPSSQLRGPRDPGHILAAPSLAPLPRGSQVEFASAPASLIRQSIPLS